MPRDVGQTQRPPFGGQKTLGPGKVDWYAQDASPRTSTADSLSYLLGSKQAFSLLLVTPARTCLSEVSRFSMGEAADSRRLGMSFGELFLLH